jgi:hypothetical protein
MNIEKPKDVLWEETGWTSNQGSGENRRLVTDEPVEFEK